MTWANFYLICFVVGFVFSLVSFLLGGVRWHLPHGLGAAHGHVHGGHAAGHGALVPFFNPVTLAAFLAWFGGVGYLLTRYSGIWVAFGLLLALACGVLGAGLVFLFLSRVLTAPDENLDPADFDMVGVLGQLSVPIRPAGTGELIYSQAGTRRTCGARSEDGNAIAKGTEVVVTRYDKGIAYVKTWEQMSGETEGA